LVPKDTNTRLVYSTDGSAEKFCPVCRSQPCCCRPDPSQPPEKQVITLSFERKGRGGKTVTVIRGYKLTRSDQESLLTELKKACGSGGTLRVDHMELQGDRRDAVALYLVRKGFRIKRSGG